MPVVHAVSARLRSDADPEAVEGALSAASALSDAPAVEAAHIGRSPRHLVVAVWLPDAGALEPFAASAPHMNFVMRGLAPVIAGMWSISVAVDAPAPATPPAAIWAFAVPEAEGIFEWQVRRQLERVASLPSSSWVGPTVEERERYRAGGVVLIGAGEAEAFEQQVASTIDAELHVESAYAPAAVERTTS